MKSTIILLILLIIQGCISTSRQKVYQANLHSDYVIDSVSNFTVSFDSRCLDMYDSFQKSKNEVDIFYYDFKHRHGFSNAIRLFKKEADSKIEMYKIENNRIVETKCPDNIEYLISTFTNKGSFLISDPLDILNNALNTLEVRKNGEVFFKLINYTSSIKYKEQDLEKIKNGAALIHALNCIK